MNRKRSGSIVNCASILGVFGQSGTAAYSAAKGAVVNMTRTLALEDEASFVTGANLLVDGGFTAGKS
ncbi:SDR family oxidoreductase [Natronospirillum operosum]|uniref:SDR family oxidoreductase n=1 Tax=Natronospirillum operosum TaxID=2759953 RepID=A0A4Z0WBB1_9GAMM|nr:SDR family oxidoreductase [Natronospirillum operosum]TGG95064.1 SDR family oxidoreductase [Natronospirillum operosum]